MYTNATRGNYICLCYTHYAKNPEVKGKLFLALLAVLSFTVIVLVIQIKEGFSTNELYIKLAENYSLLFWVLILFNLLLGPIYTLLSIRVLRRHRRNIGKEFSYTENIDLNWLRYLLIINIVVWGIATLVSVIEIGANSADPKIGSYIIFTTLTIAVFFLGFFGIKQQIHLYTSRTQCEAVWISIFGD